MLPELFWLRSSIYFEHHFYSRNMHCVAIFELFLNAFVRVIVFSIPFAKFLSHAYGVLLNSKTIYP